MEYNLAGIRQRVLVDKLDDDEFDPQVVDNFINDTQRDIFNSYELPFMEKIFSGSIQAGTTIFAMPKDAALVQSRVITSPNGAQRSIKQGQLAFRDFNQSFPTPGNNAPGPITVWALYANNMLTSCPTDDDYTLTMFYIKKADTLKEDDDVPEIPEEFSELLVLGAYMRVLQRNEDFDLATSVENEYDKIMTKMVNRYGFREADGPIVMKNTNQRATRGRTSLVRKSYN